MRVLIARLSAMGDVVHGIAAVRALCDARRDWEIAWIVQPAFVPLLRGIGLAEILTFDRRGGLRARFAARRALRAFRPDVALDLQGNWKSASLCRASGAPRRIGAVRAQRSEPFSALLLDQRVTADSRHPADIALALVRCLDPEIRPHPVPVLEADAGAVDHEAQALRTLGIDPSRPFRVLVVAAQDDHRAIRSAAIARECAVSREPVLALAGPDEVSIELPIGVPVLRHARGELPRLIALGRIAQQAGAVVIGPDKGATHVLCAAGARTVVVHGPTDPLRTAPRDAHVLRSASPPRCMPCDARRCTHREGAVCMDVASGDAR
ncbi:MAG: glycosyltransferase family 9 protein [Planctomycetota bacterium]